MPLLILHGLIVNCTQLVLKFNFDGKKCTLKSTELKRDHTVHELKSIELKRDHDSSYVTFDVLERNFALLTPLSIQDPLISNFRSRPQVNDLQIKSLFRLCFSFSNVYFCLTMQSVICFSS